MMVTSPLEERDGRRDGPSSRSQPLAPSFATLEPPTAKGILETTPLPHVLVYMLDHQLSGTVVLYPPGQAENAIVFLNGIPATVKLGLPGYFLGEYLTESGALRPDQLNDAVRAAKQDGSLMGEFLVRRGAVSRGVLQDALERQLIQRVAFLANLPPRTEYSYFADRNLLGEWGSDGLVKIGALNAVLAAVRIWKDRARVAATLARLGNHQLVMHERVDLAALHLTPSESAVLDALITRQPTYAVLNSLQIGDSEVAASLVYSLAVTRQFAFPGQVKAPMAPRTSLAPAAAPAPAPPRRPVAPASSSQMSARPAAPARVVKRNPASGPERAAPATAFPTERTATPARPGTVTPVSPQVGDADDGSGRARRERGSRGNAASAPRRAASAAGGAAGGVGLAVEPTRLGERTVDLAGSLRPRRAGGGTDRSRRPRGAAAHAHRQHERAASGARGHRRRVIPAAAALGIGLGALAGAEGRQRRARGGCRGRHGTLPHRGDAAPAR